jgi:hypothetical protein
MRKGIKWDINDDAGFDVLVGAWHTELLANGTNYSGDKYLCHTTAPKNVSEGKLLAILPPVTHQWYNVIYNSLSQANKDLIEDVPESWYSTGIND